MFLLYSLVFDGFHENLRDLLLNLLFLSSLPDWKTSLVLGFGVLTCCSKQNKKQAKKQTTGKKKSIRLCPTAGLCDPKRLCGPVSIASLQLVHTLGKKKKSRSPSMHAVYCWRKYRCVSVWERVCVGCVLVWLVFPALWEAISPVTYILAQAQKQR